MIEISVENGPSYSVNYVSGMSGRDALEAAYVADGGQGKFTFAIKYYGPQLGYLVDMINETYDTFISSYHPFFFWEFLINGVPSNVGIDSANLSDGDEVGFRYVTYSESEHRDTALEAKYKARTLALPS